MNTLLLIGTAAVALSIASTTVVAADGVMAKKRIEVSESAEGVWEK